MVPLRLIELSISRPLALEGIRMLAMGMFGLSGTAREVHDWRGLPLQRLW